MKVEVEDGRQRRKTKMEDEYGRQRWKEMEVKTEMKDKYGRWRWNMNMQDEDSRQYGILRLKTMLKTKIKDKDERKKDERHS